MRKEIHFYESKNVYPIEKVEIFDDWESINETWMNDNAPDIIHTNQMCMLSNTWIMKGYRMFVHQGNGVMYEIRFKDRGRPDDQWTVRPAQNTYAMWAGGVFRVVI